MVGYGESGIAPGSKQANQDEDERYSHCLQAVSIVRNCQVCHILFRMACRRVWTLRPHLDYVWRLLPVRFHLEQRASGKNRTVIEVERR